jgi:hypothetical protein
MLWNTAVSQHRRPSQRVVQTINQIVCNVVLIPFAIVLIYAAPTRAGPCSAEIARLEMVLGKAQFDRQAVVSAPETVDARLHHQPTPETVGKATAEAEENVEAAFAAARKLESEGKDTECVATLAKVAVPLGMH